MDSPNPSVDILRELFALYRAASPSDRKIYQTLITNKFQSMSPEDQLAALTSHVFDASVFSESTPAPAPVPAPVPVASPAPKTSSVNVRSPATIAPPPLPPVSVDHDVAPLPDPTVPMYVLPPYAPTLPAPYNPYVAPPFLGMNVVPTAPAPHSALAAKGKAHKKDAAPMRTNHRGAELPKDFATFRTQLCKHYNAGNCKVGAACFFAHGWKQMRARDRNIAEGLTTDEGVKYFQKYGHGPPMELRRTYEANTTAREATDPTAAEARSLQHSESDAVTHPTPAAAAAAVTATATRTAPDSSDDVVQPTLESSGRDNKAPSATPASDAAARTPEPDVKHPQQHDDDVVVVVEDGQDDEDELQQQLRKLTEGGHNSAVPTDATEAERREMATAWTFRSKLCETYKSTGTCPNGSRCRDAHGQGELRTLAQNLPLTSQRAIDYFLDTGRPPPHRPIPVKFRATVCPSVAYGVPCFYGDECWFGHGEHDVRTLQQNIADKITTRAAVEALIAQLNSAAAEETNNTNNNAVQSASKPLNADAAPFFAPLAVGAAPAAHPAPSIPLPRHLGGVQPTVMPVRVAPKVEPPPSSAVAEQFRTLICKPFMTHGVCPRGKRCTFAHDPVQLRTAEQNIADGLTSEDAVKRYQKAEASFFPPRTPGMPVYAVAPVTTFMPGQPPPNVVVIPGTSAFAVSPDDARAVAGLREHQSKLGVSPFREDEVQCILDLWDRLMQARERYVSSSHGALVLPNQAALQERAHVYDELAQLYEKVVTSGS